MLFTEQLSNMPVPEVLATAQNRFRTLQLYANHEYAAQRFVLIYRCVAQAIACSESDNVVCNYFF